MAELKNTFSWSYSAASDFEVCRRRRYWSKYGKWGGWNPTASPEQRKAYQLDKMDNLYSLLGQAVERTVMWVLRQHQQGQTVSVDQAYEEVARPFLNTGWSDSIKRRWEGNPKRYCCLREHYYRQLTPEQGKAMTQDMARRVRTCTQSFITRVLPRLEGVTRETEIPVETPDTPGDCEHFMLGDIKIYAIPDYVYRKDGRMHVHDWKSGRIREDHRVQLSVYALWAHEKHGVAPEDVLIYVEYLKEGAVHVGTITEQDLEVVRLRIDQSVADMSEYLVDADRERNVPMPRDEWELTLDAANCTQCNFLELCTGELRALGMV
jgi:CRISPR/Cas system-associated exonuclease Cas4 (RecB family)